MLGRRRGPYTSRGPRSRIGVDLIHVFPPRAHELWRAKSKCSNCKQLLHFAFAVDTLILCYFNAGTASQTMAQHWNSIGSILCVNERRSSAVWSQNAVTSYFTVTAFCTRTYVCISGCNLLIHGHGRRYQPMPDRRCPASATLAQHQTNIGLTSQIRL